MNVDKIDNLEELLGFKREEKKIATYKITRLTSAGENYGSLIVAVDIKVKDGEEIQAVAKLVPPNEFIQELFNTPVTFRNEIYFYETVVPILQNFQKTYGVTEPINCFPKFYGGRISLDPKSRKVDNDAVLLLENLKAHGYTNMDRTVGFDLDAAEIIVQDLAQFHAVPLALKMQNPKIVEEKIKPYLAPLIPSQELENEMIQNNLELVGSIKECQHLVDKVRVALETGHQGAPREPFATISHNDCWVNNTMVKFVNGKPIANKLVDFQICDYGSPAKDLLFFLFTSVKSTVFLQYYDDLVKLYYNTFIDVLKTLQCDVTPFSFDAFQKELDHEAKYSQFFHIVTMLVPIFAQKGSVKEIADFTPADFGNLQATKEHKEKLAFVLDEFIKRNWI